MAALSVRHWRRRHLTVHDGRRNAGSRPPALGHHLHRRAASLRVLGRGVPDDGTQRDLRRHCGDRRRDLRGRGGGDRAVGQEDHQRAQAHFPAERGGRRRGLPLRRLHDREIAGHDRARGDLLCVIRALLFHQLEIPVRAVAVPLTGDCAVTRMFAAINMAISLLKLRIGVAIAASALAGIAASSGPAPAWWQTMGLAVAVLGASGAAGAFNHYYERDIDRLMRRTRSRPFATGMFQASPWWLAGFLSLLVASLALAAATGGTLAAVFVFLGAFTYGIVYTVWLKRRSVWNIVVGGLSGSFAVLAGAAAVDPAPQVVPLVLAGVLFLWTPPHFWSLAAAQGGGRANGGVPMLP